MHPERHPADPLGVTGGAAVDHDADLVAAAQPRADVGAMPVPVDGDVHVHVHVHVAVLKDHAVWAADRRLGERRCEVPAVVKV